MTALWIGLGLIIGGLLMGAIALIKLWGEYIEATEIDAFDDDDEYPSW